MVYCSVIFAIYRFSSVILTLLWSSRKTEDLFCRELGLAGAKYKLAKVRNLLVCGAAVSSEF